MSCATQILNLLSQVGVYLSVSALPFQATASPLELNSLILGVGSKLWLSITGTAGYYTYLSTKWKKMQIGFLGQLLIKGQSQMQLGQLLLRDR